MHKTGLWVRAKHFHFVAMSIGRPVQLSGPNQCTTNGIAAARRHFFVSKIFNRTVDGRDVEGINVVRCCFVNCADWFPYPIASDRRSAAKVEAAFQYEE